MSYTPIAMQAEILSSKLHALASDRHNSSSAAISSGFPHGIGQVYEIKGRAGQEEGRGKPARFGTTHFDWLM